MKRLLAIAAVVSLAAVSHATTVRRLSLEQVRDRAESIFIGKVISSSVRDVANGHFKATDYVVEVSDVLYGAAPHTTTVTFLGGGSFDVDGVPKLEVDREYVFFRTAAPNNTTVGWGQGLFRIEGKQLVSGDGEPLIVRNGALARGRNATVRAEAARDEAQLVPGVATNADGTPARRLRTTAAAAQELTAPATLEDLKAFVRARSASSK